MIAGVSYFLSMSETICENKKNFTHQSKNHQPRDYFSGHKVSLVRVTLATSTIHQSLEMPWFLTRILQVQYDS